MDSLDEFELNRRVIEDFASQSLARIDGDFSRLLYVATLREMASGRYEHQGLSAVYSVPATDQALRLCHEELFEKILETPLEMQDRELRKCLAGFDGAFDEVAHRWSEHEIYRMLIPSGAPNYMRRLFCSNVNVLLSLLTEQEASPRSDA